MITSGKSYLQIQLESEARRIADQLGVQDYAEYQHIFRSVAHEHFMMAIRPLLKAKSDAFCLIVPKRWIMSKDAISVPEYELPPAVSELFAEIDRQIRVEAERYGVTLQ